MSKYNPSVINRNGGSSGRVPPNSYAPSQIHRRDTDTLSERSNSDKKPLPSKPRAPMTDSFLKVPIMDDRIEELLDISKPSNLSELKKLAENHPTQWSPKSLISALERLADTSPYSYTVKETVVMFELHLRTFASVLEVFCQNPIILNRNLRQRLYDSLAEFNDIHHNISVATYQGLHKTWKGKLQHLNVADIELDLPSGCVQRNYNIDFLLIHLRDTIHSLSDDETKFREGWRRVREFFKGVLGLASGIGSVMGVPNFIDNANALTTWGKMRDAFGFKVPVSNCYKDWRLLLMLKHTLDTEANSQNLKKFGERMLLEYLWFHAQQIWSKIGSSRNEDFEFAKVFNNKKKLFAELTGMEPLSYPHTLWFGILDLAGSVSLSSTNSITLSLCYYLALESLNHSPSTFIRFKAIELLLSLEHRKRDWFGVVNADLDEYANRIEKRAKFAALIDYVKYKLAISCQSRMNSRNLDLKTDDLQDDFPAFTDQGDNRILNLVAEELLCPVMLQISDVYYALNCGHFMSKKAFDIYKTVQNKKERLITCTICRMVIVEESITLLPQTSTLGALSKRLNAAGLIPQETIASSEFEIMSVVSEDIKKPPNNIDDVISKHFANPTDPPDPLQYVRDCYKKNPHTALLILDKTLMSERNDPCVLLERAKVYIYLKRFGEALIDLSTALQYDNHNMESYFLRSKIHLLSKNFKESLNDINIYINWIESLKTGDENFQYSQTDLEAYELRGNVHKELGSIQKGIYDYSLVLENDKSNIKVLASRGALFRELRKYNEALEDLTQAIRCNPNNLFALSQRGSVYCKIDRLSESLNDLNHVSNNTTIEEEKLWCLAERGDVFRKQNKYYEALYDLDYVLEQQPENIFALSRRGCTHFMLKKYDASFQDLNNVLNLDKHNYFSLLYRGMIYANKCDYSNSLKDFNTVIKRYPENLVAIRQRGILQFTAKKYDESLSDFNKLIHVNKGDVGALCYRADIFCELGRYKDCLEDCNTALKYDASNLHGLRVRGKALRRCGQNNKSLIDLDKVLMQQPEDLIALNQRAAVLTSMKRYNEALKDCEKILILNKREDISSFQERVTVYNDLTEVLGVDEILIHLGRVLQDSPKNPLGLTTRAYIYLLKWDCDKAIEDLNFTLKYKPNYILGLYQRSIIRRMTKDYNNALKDLKRILDLEPENNFAQTEKNEIESMKVFDQPNHYNQTSSNQSQPGASRQSSGSSLSSSTSASASSSMSSGTRKKSNAQNR
ncbi:2563_t:CDS:2 [Funneliformis geosporum]|uniref:16555_t:CDS:1 n=1 Tax=Funneliformis geosporum TaxID=1117311 RepID=A0A9W4SPG7_9GLOM|nr:2563_t:CDS:2 [Funneliformis geosporum]CAI2176854.1 16555_t:CDS:2 [Funneliformis geosporum]